MPETSRRLNQIHRLINSIIVVKTTDKETVFSINDDSISVKTGEEKEFEIGKNPYSTRYIIKVSNVKFGRILEL